jgi:hypothetical protein
MADLKLTLSAEDKASATVNKVAAEVRGFAQASEETTRVSVGMGTAVGLAFAQFAVTRGIDLAVSALKASVVAAADAEVQLAKMNQALRVSGQFSQEASDGLVTWSGQMQNATGVADDQVQSMVALFLSYGNTINESKKLAQAALDMSVMVGSAEGAALLLTKAAEGSTQGLNRLGIKLSAAEVEARGVDAILEKVQEKFGGQASAQLETYSGQWNLLKENMNNMAEDAGGTVLPTMTRMMAALNDQLRVVRDLNVETAKANFKELQTQLSEVEKAIATADTDAQDITGFLEMREKILERMVKAKGEEYAQGKVNAEADKQAAANRQAEADAKKAADEAELARKKAIADALAEQKRRQDLLNDSARKAFEDERQFAKEDLIQKHANKLTFLMTTMDAIKVANENYIAREKAAETAALNELTNLYDIRTQAIGRMTEALARNQVVAQATASKALSDFQKAKDALIDFQKISLATQKNIDEMMGKGVGVGADAKIGDVNSLFDEAVKKGGREGLSMLEDVARLLKEMDSLDLLGGGRGFSRADAMEKNRRAISNARSAMSLEPSGGVKDKAKEASDADQYLEKTRAAIAELDKATKDLQTDYALAKKAIEEAPIKADLNIQALKKSVDNAQEYIDNTFTEDFMTRTLTIKVKTEASPVRPFSEGMDAVENRLLNLPTKTQHTLKMNPDYSTGSREPIRAGTGPTNNFSFSPQVNLGGRTGSVYQQAIELETVMSKRWNRGVSRLRQVADRGRYRRAS